MPLSGESLARQLDEVGPRLRDRRETLRQAAEQARRLLTGTPLSTFQELVAASRPSWVVASPLEVPLAGRQESDRVKDYVVVATDSSYIEPDRHLGTALLSLINVGRVVLRYGAEADAELDALPSLYSDDPEADADELAAEGAILAGQCALRELEQGLELARAAGADLVLKDGSLNLWGLAALKNPRADSLQSRYHELLQRFEDEGVPLVGYISLPRARSLVNLLRLSRCDKPVAVCGDTCRGDRPADGCYPFLGLTDADVLWGLLEERERTAPLLAHSRHTARLGHYPRDIHACYLHVGPELARLEFPAWLVPRLSRLQGLILDQCRRGGGYPTALAEAHEQAVLRGEDRELFRLLAEEAGLTGSGTEKYRLKRVRGV